MTRDELLRTMAEILEVDAAEVREDSDLEELGWDSLADLNLVSIADERYRVVLDPKRLAASETAGDVIALFPVAA